MGSPHRGRLFWLAVLVLCGLLALAGFETLGADTPATTSVTTIPATTIPATTVGTRPPEASVPPTMMICGTIIGCQSLAVDPAVTTATSTGDDRVPEPDTPPARPDG